jgi:hypothetical protein
MAIRTIKDASLKLILGNHELFVQFLHDFIPLDALKDVRPDDIEDLSERFLPLVQEGRDADTVKRITLKDKAPLFVIAIVEHESEVNFRTPFKLLQYICFALDRYEKDMEEEQPGVTTRKGFRYPPVLPIVFHDGAQPWTAVRNFRDRTALNEVFGKYIPGFEYILVDLKSYRVEDIVKFNDVLSLVMLIDRIGSMKTKEELGNLPKDYFERMGLQIPEGLIKLLHDVVTLLMNRFEYPEEDIEEITGYIDKKENKAMFEALVEQHWRLRDEGLAEGIAKGRAEGIEQEHKRASQEKIEGARKQKTLGVSTEIIAAGFGLSPEEIDLL